MRDQLLNERLGRSRLRCLLFCPMALHCERMNTGRAVEWERYSNASINVRTHHHLIDPLRREGRKEDGCDTVARILVDNHDLTVCARDFSHIRGGAARVDPKREPRLRIRVHVALH